MELPGATEPLPAGARHDVAHAPGAAPARRAGARAEWCDADLDEDMLLGDLEATLVAGAMRPGNSGGTPWPEAAEAAHEAQFARFHRVLAGEVKELSAMHRVVVDRLEKDLERLRKENAQLQRRAADGGPAKPADDPAPPRPPVWPAQELPSAAADVGASISGDSDAWPRALPPVHQSHREVARLRRTAAEASGPAAEPPDWAPRRRGPQFAAAALAAARAAATAAMGRPSVAPSVRGSMFSRRASSSPHTADTARAAISRRYVSSAEESMPRSLNTLPTARGVAGVGAGRPQRRGLFQYRAMNVKERIREMVTKKDRSEKDFYWKEGVLPKLAASKAFEMCTLLTIVLNAVWIGIETDLNDSPVLNDAHPVFQAGEHFFCLFFFCEWLTRFIAFRRKADCLQEKWFIFDTGIMIPMVLETWALSLFFAILRALGGEVGLSSKMGNVTLFRLIRMLRLVRLLRIAKVLRCVPELLVVVNAMTYACRAVVMTLGLLLSVIYTTSVGFTSVTRDMEIGQKYFRSVPAAMHTLMIVGAFPDLTEILWDIVNENLMVWFGMFVYILIASLCIMNMMVGVLVEVVKSASHTEKEALDAELVRTTILDWANDRGWDTSDPKEVTLTDEDCWELMDDQKARTVFQDVGVDVMELVDILEMQFVETRAMEFPTFVELVLQLRSGNQATVKDLIITRKVITHELRSIRKLVARRAPA